MKFSTNFGSTIAYGRSRRRPLESVSRSVDTIATAINAHKRMSFKKKSTYSISNSHSSTISSKCNVFSEHSVHSSECSVLGGRRGAPGAGACHAAEDGASQLGAARTPAELLLWSRVYWYYAYWHASKFTPFIPKQYLYSKMAQKRQIYIFFIRIPPVSAVNDLISMYALFVHKHFKQNFPFYAMHLSRY